MDHSGAVQHQDAGERLDKWLCAKFPQFSRHQIKSLLDNGRVLVNRRRVVIAGWELEEGDDVCLRLPADFEKRLSGGDRHAGDDAPGPEDKTPRPAGMERAKSLAEQVGIQSSLERYFSRQQQRRHTPPPQTQQAQENRKPSPHRQHDRKGQRRDEPNPKDRGPGHDRRLRIYHEDRDLIVVEKRAGLLSVPSEKKEEDRESLLSEIHAYLKRRHREHKHSFVAPLHRLDTETSGIMVFALSKEGQRLEQQFRDHSIRREYVALVSGRLEEEQGIIDIPIEKGDFPGGKKVRPAPQGEGRRAVTEFRVKERYANATLVELRVRTGRTHQIRVHLSEKGHPLLGDKLYASPSAPPPIDFHRQALHAIALGFRHPATKRKYTFHSPLPKDLRDLVDQLRTG